MSSWRFHLNLSDVFHNDELSFEQTRDEIVRRIKAANFYSEDDAQLAETVDELAETDDVSYFDFVWGAFYDWADSKRVWVVTR